MMNIVIAGDFCPQYRVAELFEKAQFEYVLGDLQSFFSKADYSILNFECPVCEGYEIPIEKRGPNLKCTLRGLEAVSWLNVNCITLANNHFLDYGESGVKNTLSVSQRFKIDTVGGGKNLEDATKVLIKTIGNKKIAVINCCEHEFSIATGNTAGSNPLNPVHQYYDIKKAKVEADIVIVIVHGGHEMWQLPSPRMVETYRFFIDAGADAVVNHHQHCFSGYEVYNGKPIFYGLGNFCFDNNKNTGKLWEEGYLVNLQIENNKVDFSILPYKQCGEEPKVYLLEQEEKEMFLNEISILNNIIQDRKQLQNRYDDYISKSTKSMAIWFEPYRSKLAKLLYRKHLLPSLLSKKRKIALLALLQCESHLPKVIKFLSQDEH